MKPRQSPFHRSLDEHRCERLVARSALLDTSDIRSHGRALDLFLTSYCAGRGRDVRTMQVAPSSTPSISERTWTPVGVGGDDKQPIEFDRVLAYLAGGRTGLDALAVVDRTVARLPGFAGLTPFSIAGRGSLDRCASIGPALAA